MYFSIDFQYFLVFYKGVNYGEHVEDYANIIKKIKI